MRFMNRWEITDTVQRWNDGEHPVLAAASRTISSLMDWTDANSDGWAYWPKPARAAAKLMELIEGDGTWEARRADRPDVTVAAYKAALRPIKAFRTRQGADFEIVEV